MNFGAYVGIGWISFMAGWLLVVLSFFLADACSQLTIGIMLSSVCALWLQNASYSKSV